MGVACSSAQAHSPVHAPVQKPSKAQQKQALKLQQQAAKQKSYKKKPTKRNAREARDEISNSQQSQHHTTEQASNDNSYNTDPQHGGPHLKQQNSNASSFMLTPPQPYKRSSSPNNNQQQPGQPGQQQQGQHLTKPGEHNALLLVHVAPSTTLNSHRSSCNTSETFAGSPMTGATLVTSSLVSSLTLGHNQEEGNRRATASTSNLNYTSAFSQLANPNNASGTAGLTSPQSANINSNHGGGQDNEGTNTARSTTFDNHGARNHHQGSINGGSTGYNSNPNYYAANKLLALPSHSKQQQQQPQYQPQSQQIQPPSQLSYHQGNFSTLPPSSPVGVERASSASSNGSYNHYNSSQSHQQQQQQQQHKFLQAPPPAAMGPQVYAAPHGSYSQLASPNSTAPPSPISSAPSSSNGMVAGGLPGAGSTVDYSACPALLLPWPLQQKAARALEKGMEELLSHPPLFLSLADHPGSLYALPPNPATRVQPLPIPSWSPFNSPRLAPGQEAPMLRRKLNTLAQKHVRLVLERMTPQQILTLSCHTRLQPTHFLTTLANPGASASFAPQRIRPTTGPQATPTGSPCAFAILPPSALEALTSTPTRGGAIAGTSTSATSPPLGGVFPTSGVFTAQNAAASMASIPPVSLEAHRADNQRAADGQIIPSCTAVAGAATLSLATQCAPSSENLALLEYRLALLAAKSEWKAMRAALPLQKTSLFARDAYLTQGVPQDRLAPRPLPDQRTDIDMPHNSVLGFMRGVLHAHAQQAPPSVGATSPSSVAGSSMPTPSMQAVGGHQVTQQQQQQGTSVTASPLNSPFSCSTPSSSTTMDSVATTTARNSVFAASTTVNSASGSSTTVSMVGVASSSSASAAATAAAAVRVGRRLVVVHTPEKTVTAATAETTTVASPVQQSQTLSPQQSTAVATCVTPVRASPSPSVAAAISAAAAANNNNNSNKAPSAPTSARGGVSSLLHRDRTRTRTSTPTHAGRAAHSTAHSNAHMLHVDAHRSAGGENMTLETLVQGGGGGGASSARGSSSCDDRGVCDEEESESSPESVSSSSRREGSLNGLSTKAALIIPPRASPASEACASPEGAAAAAAIAMEVQQLPSSVFLLQMHLQQQQQQQQQDARQLHNKLPGQAEEDASRVEINA